MIIFIGVVSKSNMRCAFEWKCKRAPLLEALHEFYSEPQNVYGTGVTIVKETGIAFERASSSLFKTAVSNVSLTNICNG